MSKNIAAITVAIVFSSMSFRQSNGLPGNEKPSFSKDSLAEHIRILASDSFEGRKPFSTGEIRTVDYLQKTFRSMGLEPGNGNSFIQEVPMVKITPTPDPVMHIEGPAGNFDLQNTYDYVMGTQQTSPVVSLNKDELVFAGFGIVAPEYNWNDYANIDVKGKVVLVLVNDPGFRSGDPAFFKGDTMTYYGRWTYKYEEAARQGAKACLIIHTTEAASYPFSVVQNSWGTSNLFLDNKGDKTYRLAMQGWVTKDAANRLLQAAGRDSSLITAAHKRGFKAVPLNERLTTSLHIQAEFNKSRNVIAKIPGTKRPGEYIIYTAHWDHLGVGKPDEQGDSIYNGALDNASGTAALLEIARAFSRLETKPERTLLFISVTGEEQGLLGSEYYAEHPLYPLNKTVAELNMDGINVSGKTKDIVITGQGQSQLDDYVKRETEKQGRYIAPEPHPEGGHYFRSDHFSFAKVGVPALDMSSGIDDALKGKSYGRELQDDYVAHRYHRPSDEFDPRWTYEGGLQDMEILFNIGEGLAYSNEWPQWKPGSEFRAVREKSRR